MENVQAKQLLDKNQFFYFNQTDKLKKQPLRHSFFFTGCDSLRDVKSEDASPFTDHINKLITSKGSFQRGFYTSMRGEAHALPIPFPRFFTPRALTENGLLKPEVEESQKAKQKDDFVLSVPSLVKLAQDGSYLSTMEGACTSLKKMKLSLRMNLLKENLLEEDELREIQENLVNMVEEYKMISCDSSDESEEDEDQMDDGY